MGRKAKFPPSVYHHKKGYDFCRVKGKEIYLGKTGSPVARKEYARLVAELVASQGASLLNAKTLTVAELIRQYDLAAEARQDWRQLKRIRYALAPVHELYGDIPAADFGPLALEAVRQVFIGRGYTREYINALVILIRQAWRWATARQLVPGSLYESLRALERLDRRSGVPDRPKVKPVDFAVVERTLPLLASEVATMARLQCLTGMRSSEVVVMRPADIDRQAAKVGDVPVWLYTPHKHKNEWRGMRRDIPLGPRAQAILQAYLDRDPESYCFSPKEVLARRSKELSRHRCRPGRRRRRRPPGDHYTSMSYSRHVANAIRAHNKRDAEATAKDNRPANPIPPWTPRQIRKAVATANALKDLDAASCVLGHAATSTTDLHYRQRLAKAIAAIVEFG